MTDTAYTRIILVFVLLVLIVAELCFILWGGEGTFTQSTRVGLLCLGLAGLVFALAWRGDE